MGASDSKLVFKQGIFRLSEEKDIPADDPYWTGFWQLPESTEDVFSLFSPVDIRRTRDTSLANLETLILALTSRLFILRNHPSFPDPEIAPDRDALNCIRILSRVLPFLYEADHLESWEDRFFWGARKKRSRNARNARIARSEVLFDEAQPDENPLPRDASDEFEEAKPLAEELIDTLIDMLFFCDFTLPMSQNEKNKVRYSIWSSGVGCNTSIGTSKEFESNRTEILRLLLTLTSRSMYMSANILPTKGVKAITYIATCPDKQVVLSVLCSLLNTTLKYNPASWRLPYDHVVLKDPKQILVTYCLQFLLVLLLYPIPDDGYGTSQKNYYRHYLGRLHRPQDFQFLQDGMTRILHQPLQATSSYLPGSQKSLKWAPEMMMLFWEALQCNKRFRSFIVDTDRAHDFVVFAVFYAMEYMADPSKQGVVKMCVFVLQTLSVEPNFGKRLNKKFENQDALPPSIRLADFSGTYADHLVISTFTLLTASKGRLDAIYPALLAIINNIAGYIENLGANASSKLLQLFASMSSPAFLLANETNHLLLHSLLEAMNAIIEHQYSENSHFILAVIQSKKRFEALRSFTLKSGQAEIERLNERRKATSSEPGSPASPARVLRTSSMDGARSPASTRTPTLSNVPEESTAFAIGEDEDSDDDDYHQPTPSQSSPSRQNSRTPSVSSSVDFSVDDAVPMQLRGMSEKARGKMPAGQPSFSRQNSTTSLNSHSATVFSTGTDFAPTSDWIETWLPELPLHTVLTLISELSPRLSPPGASSPESRSSLDIIRRTQIRGIDPSPLRVHLFEWSPLSMGWYESLLWSFIFASEMVVTKGTVGVWNGTAIKLFKVQETAAEGPTLLAPKGAVDAVGSSLVQRIGSLSLRGQESQRASGGGGNAPVTVRDV